MFFNIHLRFPWGILNIKAILEDVSQAKPLRLQLERSQVARFPYHGRYKNETYLLAIIKSTLLRGKKVEIVGSNSPRPAGRQMRTGWSEPNWLQIHFLQSTGVYLTKGEEGG
jgi:hypothetical protein